MFESVAKTLLKECEGRSMLMSFYIDCDRSRRSVKEISIDLKNLQKKAIEEEALFCGESDCKQYSEKITSILNRLNEELVHGGLGEAKGIACFVDLQGDYYRFVELPTPVKNQVKFSDHPFLAPLIETLCPHKLTLVAVVEARRANFFRVYASTVDKLLTLVDDVPPKVKSAGWYGLEETRIKRHVENHVKNHLKNVAATLRALYEDEDYSLILVGGNSNYALVVADLIKEIVTNIPVDVLAELGITDQPHVVVEAVTSYALKSFVVESSKLVEEIITEYEKGGLAVAGLRGVVYASNLFAVHQLLIDEYEPVAGKQCQSCGALGVDEVECPLCHGEMGEIEDLIDLLIYKTLRDNGDVLVIGGQSPLREYDGIGASLRFAV